jgi:hypothetical protein
MRVHPFVRRSQAGSTRFPLRTLDRLRPDRRLVSGVSLCPQRGLWSQSVLAIPSASAPAPRAEHRDAGKDESRGTRFWHAENADAAFDDGVIITAVVTFITDQ